MRPDLIPETYRCEACGFLKSFFPIEINKASRIDETARETALKPLRTRSFQTILDDIARDVPPPASVLDVGSAHGWFMEEAERRGYSVTGIEPRFRDRSARQGQRRARIFPDAAPGRYDLITFNDVFEHLPEPAKMMRAVAERLTPNGRAIINLPVSDGLIFRITRLAARLGLCGPLERMWQKGLPSPHLSYFSPHTLQRLAEANGLTLIRSKPASLDPASRIVAAHPCMIAACRKLRGVVLYVASLGLFTLARVGPIRYSILHIQASGHNRFDLPEPATAPQPQPAFASAQYFRGGPLEHPCFRGAESVPVPHQTIPSPERIRP
jgi:SAM-dependent methyltransferase